MMRGQQNIDEIKIHSCKAWAGGDRIAIWRRTVVNPASSPKTTPIYRKPRNGKKESMRRVEWLKESRENCNTLQTDWIHCWCGLSKLTGLMTSTSKNEAQRRSVSVYETGRQKKAWSFSYEIESFHWDGRYAPLEKKYNLFSALEACALLYFFLHVVITTTPEKQSKNSVKRSRLL